MMITKETFEKLITMMMNTIDDKREFIGDNDYIPDECKDCIMIDRFGLIRDYLCPVFFSVIHSRICIIYMLPF